MTFSPGDTVNFKQGDGPDCTVLQVRDDGGVECRWYNPHEDSMCRGCFDGSHLRLVYTCKKTYDSPWEDQHYAP